jgi:hypothetical protein
MLVAVQPGMSLTPGRGRLDPFDLAVEGGIVCVTMHGHVKWPQSSEALARATALARTARTGKLLFDIREADHPDFHGLVLRHAESAPELVRQGLRIAVLGLEGDRILDFIDDVATNRAVPAKSFTQKDAALAWLGA